LRKEKANRIRKKANALATGNALIEPRKKNNVRSSGVVGRRSWKGKNLESEREGRDLAERKDEQRGKTRHENAHSASVIVGTTAGATQGKSHPKGRKPGGGEKGANRSNAQE